MSNVLVYGMIIFDKIEEEHYIGGPALNVVLHMACKERFPTFISAVGNDDLGSTAKQLLYKYGILTDYLNTDSVHGTGRVNVLLDVKGNPTFDIQRDVAYDFIRLTENQYEHLAAEEYELLYFGTVSRRSAVSEKTFRELLNRCSFKNRFYDINLREGHYSDELIDFSLSHTDILKLNEHEVLKLADIFITDLKSEEEIIEWIFKKYPVKIIIITRGSRGVEIRTPELAKVLDVVDVPVKDTVGAGDAFSAAFIMEYLSSGDVVRAAEKGNELGMYVVSRTGAVPELEEFG